MRHAIAAVLVALGVWLGAGSAAGAAPAGGRSGRCVGPGAHVLARDSAVAVYETRARTSGEPRAVWACLSGHSGHMTLLAPTRLNLHVSLQRVELAGHIAAYLLTQFGVDSGTTSLVVVDVAARRVLHAVQAGSYVDAGIVAREAVERFLVTPHGSVAWSATRRDRDLPAVGSVWAAPREGAPVLLEEGEAIDAGSLALAGTTLSWTDAGAQRAAAMP